MTVDNVLNTAKVKMTYVILFAFFASTGVYTAFELNAAWVFFVEIVILSLIAITYTVMLYLKMDYFFISDDAKRITVRFYTAHPIFRKYKTFNLEQSALNGYEIRKSFFGLKRELILKGRSNKGEFIFPAVSISALSQVETDALKRFLNRYTIASKN